MGVDNALDHDRIHQSHVRRWGPLNASPSAVVKMHAKIDQRKLGRIFLFFLIKNLTGKRSGVGSIWQILTSADILFLVRIKQKNILAPLLVIQ